jgi:hypothetical protein
MLRFDVEAHDASYAKLLGRLDECSGASGRLDYHALGEVWHDPGDIREQFTGKRVWGVKLLFAGDPGVARPRRDSSEIGHAPRLTTCAHGLF